MSSAAPRARLSDWGALLAALVGVGCAPEQPAETQGCSSITQCPFGFMCDVPAGVCIEEPDDRFLGKFTCTPTDGDTTPDGLELSEVVGRIGEDRWALPGVFCILKQERDQLMVGFHGPLGGGLLTVSVGASAAAGGSVTLRPHYETGDRAASFEDVDVSRAYGYSTTGAISFAAAPTVGLQLQGYLDVSMIPVAEGEALFGHYCPQGRAACGRRTFDGGGVAFCSVVVSEPVCTRTCSGDGDCSVGDGVCVDGLCTQPCTTDADCPGPLRCYDGAPGESRGCF